MQNRLVPTLLLFGVFACAPRSAPGPSQPPAPTGVDCHMHLSSDASPQSQRQTLLEALDQAGLSHGCVLSQGSHVAPGCEDRRCEAQRAFTESQNDTALAIAGDSEGRLLPFCSVPVSAAFAADEVDRCGRNGARGLKLHLVNEGISMLSSANAGTHQSLSDVFQRAGTHSMPVLVHVAMEDSREVEALFELTARNPQTTVIAAHQIAPQIALLPRAPSNLWIEISGLTHAPVEAGGFFVPTWRAFGMDRVLLGSDHPYLSPKATVDMLSRYPLSPEERDKIVRENASRLFRLRGAAPGRPKS